MKQRPTPEMGAGGPAGDRKVRALGCRNECADHPASDSGKCIQQKRVATFPPPPRVPGMKENTPYSRLWDLQHSERITAIQFLLGGEFG